MLRLTLDVTTGNLVSWQGGVCALPPFRQGTTDVEICFVEPDPTSATGDFMAADLTGYLGVRMGLWSKSTGTLDDSSSYLLALTPHSDFTLNTADADHDDAYFTGTFNTRTTEIETWLGKKSEQTAYFAIGLVRADLSVEPIYDQSGAANAVIYSATDDASGALPTSALPGIRAITLPVYFRSADGLRSYILTENETADGLVFSQFTP